MTVLYDTRNHSAVLFKLHGTVWREVAPFCFATSLLTVIVGYLLKEYNLDLTWNSGGHSYLSIMVSFLVVGRTNTAYGRFWEARGHLENMLASMRQLSITAAAYTGKDQSQDAKIWRQSLERRMVRLVRTSMAIIQKENVCVRLRLEKLSKDDPDIMDKRYHRDIDNYIDPTELVFSVQTIILASDKYLKDDLQCTDRLMDKLEIFHTSLSHIIKFIVTPYPFPLVQMARTILLVWVFTLPFVLINVMQDEIFDAALLMFIITYGFMGLEFTSIELHDPFGTDANDFEVEKLTDVLVCDICNDLDFNYSSMYEADAEKNVPTELAEIEVMGIVEDELWEKKVPFGELIQSYTVTEDTFTCNGASNENQGKRSSFRNQKYVSTKFFKKEATDESTSLLRNA